MISKLTEKEKEKSKFFTQNVLNERQHLRRINKTKKLIIISHHEVKISQCFPQDMCLEGTFKNKKMKEQHKIKLKEVTFEE